MSAYAVFQAYLSELRSAVEFCQLSAFLRPRIIGLVDQSALPGELRGDFGKFAKGDPSEARVYQSIVVSIHSGFEQFILDLIDDGAVALSKKSLDLDSFEKKYPNVIRHYQKASGSALASIFEPRAHWKINYQELISKLSTTAVGSGSVSIYGRPYGVRMANFGCKELEGLFGSFGFKFPWGDLGSDADLQKILDARNKTVAQEEIKKMISIVLELRNALAHSQGSEVVSFDQVVQYLNFFSRFGFLLSEKYLQYVNK